METFHIIALLLKIISIMSISLSRDNNITLYTKTIIIVVYKKRYAINNVYCQINFEYNFF